MTDRPSRHLDLGCGAEPRNPYGRSELYGVDIAKPATALPFELRLCNLSLKPIPYPDSHFDSVSAFDFLEHVPRVLPTADGNATRFPFVELMDEIWRVLAPGGRVLLVVPNRAGLWARAETTPFGYGRPFGRGQLTVLLREALFSPLGWTEALAAPPFRRRPWLGTGVGWERIGRALWPAFAGVIIVEATKQLYQGIPARQGRERLKPALRPALIPPGA